MAGEVQGQLVPHREATWAVETVFSLSVITYVGAQPRIRKQRSSAANTLDAVQSRNGITIRKRENAQPCHEQDGLHPADPWPVDAGVSEPLRGFDLCVAIGVRAVHAPGDMHLSGSVPVTTTVAGTGLKHLVGQILGEDDVAGVLQPLRQREPTPVRAHHGNSPSLRLGHAPSPGWRPVGRGLGQPHRQTRVYRAWRASAAMHRADSVTSRLLAAAWRAPLLVSRSDCC